MAVRIRFIYLLFIISVSFVIFIGCEDNCSTSVFCLRDSSGNPIDSPGGGSPSFCDSGEYKCAGKCIPFEVDCCRFLSEGQFEHFPCTLSEPICCDAGTCASDLNSCPDVTICPDIAPQPCGPLCILEDDTCCNFEKDNADKFCPGASICCIDGPCRATEECCGDIDPFCGIP